jgi:monovalent cation:H+ antiporter-2, CPA2 family
METTASPILELGAVFLTAAIFGYVARRLGLPAVIGYLIVGVVAFQLLPEGMKPDREQVQLLADVGVVLLLFEVGIELDLGRLRREHRALLFAAPLQVVITTVLVGVAVILLGQDPIVAMIIGLCVALASSVVIVNITRSVMRRTNRATETALLGWSLLQDLTGVVLAAGLLAFFGAESRPPVEVMLGLLAFGGLTIVAARVFPHVLGHLHRYPDLFLLVAIAIGLLGAGIGSVVFYIPLALAAFVAGLAVTDSPMALEARHRLLPFRDVFAVLFFVGVGSLLDLGVLASGLDWVGIFIVLIVVAKVAPTYILASWAGLERPGQVSVGLGQVGEFSFVLISLVYAADALSPEIYTAFLAVIALSIGFAAVAARAPVKGWTRGAEKRHEGPASSAAGMA